MSTAFDRRSSRRELAGLVIIVIGFMMLMNSLNILPFGAYVARFWLPTLFVGIGAWQLSKARGPENMAGGLFFTIFGGVFFISRLLQWDFRFGQLILPAILIWIGLSMLMKKQHGFHHMRAPHVPFPPKPPSFGTDKMVDDPSDYIQASAVLGGFHRQCSSQQFRGADLSTIMGGGLLDLRKADMQADEAVIEVFTIMGGIEIQVPPDWVVIQRFTPILGGYEDKTQPGAGTKRIAIEGTTIMGGISVKN